MAFPLLGRWEDVETGEVLVERLFVAETYWQRLRGLQFTRTLDPNAGLLLRNCRSVHTMWMRFTLDLFFLDEELQVIEAHYSIKPWRAVIPDAKNARHVIELATGMTRNGIEGMRTQFVPLA